MEMSLIVIIFSIATAVVSFVLGLVVLGRNITNNINFNFCIFTWLVAGWEILSYAFYKNQDNFELYKYSTAIGAACLLMIITWVIYLVKDKPNTFFVAVFFVLSLSLIKIPLWDKSVMTNFSNLGGIYTFDVGFSYFIYAILVFLSVAYSFYLLIKSLFNKQGLERSRIIFVLIGMVVYVTGEMIMGVILPVLKLTPSIPYDNFGALFFIVFSSYAIMKFVPVDPLKSIV